MEEQLRSLGLSTYESSIYIALLEYGRLDAKEIAKQSTVPVTAVYPNLKKLLGKKLIQQFDGDVWQFAALHPSMALPALVKEKKKALHALGDDLVSAAESIHGKKQLPQFKEILQLSLGQHASQSIYYDALERAEQSVYIMGWRLHRVKDKFTFLHVFKKALKRGVKLRLLLMGRREKAWDVIKAYERAGIKIKYLPLDDDKFTMLIVDGKECKITLKNRSLPDRYNIHVQDVSLAGALQSYFLSSWKKAERLKK